MVYLDYNATTPLDPEVLKVIENALRDMWANPSSSYDAGVKCKQAISQARESVAEMIGSKPSDIVFTSGGTESNHLVFHSIIEHYQNGLKEMSNRNGDVKTLPPVPHIISTNIEHDSVRLPLMHWASKGLLEVTFVPVSRDTGQVEVNDLINAVRPNTCLMTVMMANNETGIIQPVAKIGQALKKINKNRILKVFLHTDAAQAVGKISIDIEDLNVDYLIIVGHKFYGPRIGALYVRDLELNTRPFHPLFFGGGQERGKRPGTENTAMITGLGQASLLVTEHLCLYETHMRNTRDYLESSLSEHFGDGVVFNKRSNVVDRLPNTCSVAFTNCSLTGSELLKYIPEVQASTGSACHATTSQTASSVLIASGVEEHLAKCTLRLSVGRETSKEDINKAVQLLKAAILV